MRSFLDSLKAVKSTTSVQFCQLNNQERATLNVTHDENICFDCRYRKNMGVVHNPTSTSGFSIRLLPVCGASKTSTATLIMELWEAEETLQI